jgi:two-component system, LuxR family, sensor kinase FixL
VNCLKADRITQDAAIIFLTALQNTHQKVKGLSLGAVDFITKPFATDEILARVARQVECRILAGNCGKRTDN